MGRFHPILCPFLNDLVRAPQNTKSFDQDAWDSFLQSSNNAPAPTNTNAPPFMYMQSNGPVGALFPGGINMNMNLDMNGETGNEGGGGDTGSGSVSQTQSPPSQSGGQNFGIAASNVFLGAGTPRSGF